MRYFCTYFDHHYSARGLALYQSLNRHCPEFKLWILCLDEPSHSELTRLNLPEVSLLTLDELERGSGIARSEGEPITHRILLHLHAFVAAVHSARRSQGRSDHVSRCRSVFLLKY